MSKMELRGAAVLNAEIERRGLTEEVRIATLKRRLASLLRAEMAEQHLSKVELAERMGTTRPQLDRILNKSEGNITLLTVLRAAKAVGKQVTLDLV